MPLFLASKSSGGGGNFILLLILGGVLFLAFGPYKDNIKKYYLKAKTELQNEVFNVAPSIEKMVESDRANRPAVPKDLGEVSKRKDFDKLTKADRQQLNDLLENR